MGPKGCSNQTMTDDHATHQRLRTVPTLTGGPARVLLPLLPLLLSLLSLLSLLLIFIAPLAHADQPGPNATPDQSIFQPSPTTTNAPPEQKDHQYFYLGRVESKLLHQALMHHGLFLDEMPGNKPIGKVHFYYADVFHMEDPIPSFMNKLHIQTRETVIIRELLFKPGDAFDWQKAEETARNLRSMPIFASVLVIPVRSVVSREHVDLLVATRDRWSLRIATSFASSGIGNLEHLSVTMEERNLMGTSQYTSIRSGLSRDQFGVGQTYNNLRLFGSRLALNESIDLYFNRDTGKFEGINGEYQLSRPLFSLDTKWSWWLYFNHDKGITRLFTGNQLRSWSGSGLSSPLPDSGGNIQLPWLYQRENMDGQIGLTRAFNGGLRHEVSAAIGFLRRDYQPATEELANMATGDGAASSMTSYDMAIPAAYLQDVVPEDIRANLFIFKYRLYTPKFRRFINLDAMGVIEDLVMGLDGSIQAGLASPLLGSPDRYSVTGLSLAWRTPLPGEGLLQFMAEGGGKIAQGANGLLDRHLLGAATCYGPWISFLRPVLHMEYTHNSRDTTKTQLSVGGDQGLRGYLAGSRWGANRALLTAEVRTKPISAGTVSIGGVLFWDSADAFNQGEQISLRHSAGVGLRIGVPQVNREIIRIDMGIPMPFSSAETGFGGFIGIGTGQAFRM